MECGSVPDSTDRELIARAIYEKARPESAATWEDASAGYRGRFYAQADAVLAAIGDRLLPVMPDGVGSIHATLFSEGWQGAVLYDDGTTHESTDRGIEPANAIRAAMDAARGEDVR